MIAYKLWYVLGFDILDTHFIMKHDARTYRRTIQMNLRLKASRNPVQNVLILLVESGLVYLGFQVSLPCLIITCFVQLTVQRTDFELGSRPSSKSRKIRNPRLYKCLWIPCRKEIVDSTFITD